MLCQEQGFEDIDGTSEMSINRHSVVVITRMLLFKTSVHQQQAYFSSSEPEILLPLTLGSKSKLVEAEFWSRSHVSTSHHTTHIMWKSVQRPMQRSCNEIFELLRHRLRPHQSFFDSFTFIVIWTLFFLGWVRHQRTNVHDRYNCIMSVLALQFKKGYNYMYT